MEGKREISHFLILKYTSTEFLCPLRKLYVSPIKSTYIRVVLNCMGNLKCAESGPSRRFFKPGSRRIFQNKDHPNIHTSIYILFLNHTQCYIYWFLCTLKIYHSPWSFWNFNLIYIYINACLIFLPWQCLTGYFVFLKYFYILR